MQVPVPSEPGPFEISAAVTDPGCSTTASRSVVVVGVGGFDIPGAELVDDGDGNPDTNLFLALVWPVPLSFQQFH